MTLPNGPLTEANLREHVWPLFSRVLQRDEIYLANHSLGRPLDRMADDVREALDLWYERLDGVWEDDGWMDEAGRFRDNIARLIGLSKPGDVVPKMSAGQGLRAVLNAIPKDKVTVVATRGEFDSIDFILKTYLERGRAEVRWVEPQPGSPALFDTVDILAAILPGVDIVMVSAVVFTTGQIIDGLDEIVAKAHEVGARVVVDVYHAAGVIPISMDALECDFMVGGSYKYVRGGTGACWLAIHPRAMDLRTLDTGWFAKKDVWSYARPEEPLRAEGGDGWLESTPAILPFYQARSGLEFTLEIGVDRLRAYGLQQLGILQKAFRREGVCFFDPVDPTQFGGFALMPHTDAKDLRKALHEAGVNTDTRSGNVRFGPDLLNSADELHRAAEITARVLAR